MSTCEAEYITVTAAVQTMQLLRRLLRVVCVGVALVGQYVEKHDSCFSTYCPKPVR